MNPLRLSSIAVRLVCVAPALVVLTAAGVQAQPAASQPVSVQGMVLNGIGGGISGAEVILERPDAKPEDPPVATATSGERGEIRLELPDRSISPMRVRVRAQGFSEYVGELDISDPEIIPFIDVTLHGEAKLSGTVFGPPDRRPLEGATVRCVNGGREQFFETDAQGAFVCGALSEGPVTLVIRKQGYASHREELSAGGEDPQVEIELVPERPFELQLLTNEGKPAHKVFVEVLTMPESSYFSASSGEDGVARIGGIRLDTEFLRLKLSGDDYVASDGYEFAQALPPVPATTTRPAAHRATMTMTRAGPVNGRVTNAAGRPIVGVKVLAGRRESRNLPADWSGPDGRYEIVGVRPGFVTLAFQHEAFAPSFARADVRTGRSSTVDMKLETGQPLAGTVVDSKGKPIEQVWVTAEEWEDQTKLGVRTVTGPDGRFAFAHMPAGEIELRFVKPGMSDPLKQRLASGSQDHQVTLEVRPEKPTATSAPAPEIKLAAGSNMPDLTLTTTDGKQIRLSDLRGKYVFLDCWASWCGPCVGEIPNVKALHAATKSREDFVLIGLSLDTDEKAFNAALKKHGLDWPQAFGPKSGAFEAFEALDGTGIPYTCLIGPDGRLIAQHLRGPGLTDAVKKAMEEGQKKPAETRPGEK